ncbi:hypothetical protein O6H91_02G156000 [Diphasiastrum complanatum]|uniref:Uncharacterized protein n=1 Tax=Diphasiastrum complanatum TaxID=34168 RepID=A0ACC2EMI5_DIPCM|nr:hypothetical protein O6H91_02G156000 [Diphasiastrum complanatum]
MERTEELCKEINKCILGLVNHAPCVRYEALLDLSKLILPDCQCQRELPLIQKECVQCEKCLRLRKIIDGIVIKAILRRVSDLLEKCRRLAVETMIGILQVFTTNVLSLLPYVLPVISERLPLEAVQNATSPEVEYKSVVVEPSEEVRVLLTKLLRLLIKAANKFICPFASNVASTLMAVANDSCPEVLLEAFVALELLGEIMEDKLKPISKQLVSVVLHSLSHNHSKVRMGAIRAIHRLVLCGAHESIYKLTAFQDPNLIPIRAFYHPDVKTQYLALLASDKNVSVRRELLQTITSWLQNLCERKEHEVRLLPPCLGARIMVRGCLGLLLHAIGADLQAWTCGTKSLAANFLHTILIFAEEHSTMHLQPLVIMLIKGSKDSLIADKMFECAKLMGYFVDPSAYLPILLPQITGEISGNITSEQAGRVIKLLSFFMHGSSPTVLTAHIPDICSTITEQELLTSLHQEVAEGMVMLCKRMVVALRGECEETLSVLWILINAIAVGELCRRSTIEAENVLEELAKASSYSSAAVLTAAYMTQLMSLLRHPSLWAGWSLEVFIVSKFLEFASLADHYAVEKLFGVLEYFTEISTDQEVKLRLLMALQNMLMEAHSRCFGAEDTNTIVEDFLQSCINVGGPLLQPASRVIKALITSKHWEGVPASLTHLLQEIPGIEVTEPRGRA